MSKGKQGGDKATHWVPERTNERRNAMASLADGKSPRFAQVGTGRHKQPMPSPPPNSQSVGPRVAA